MDVKKIILEIESSEEFKSIGPEHYLVHIFRMMDAHSPEECQVGYYNKESDKIVIFDYVEGKISIMPPQDAFKEKNYISPLDLEKVNLSMDDALNIVQKIINDNYKGHLLSKIILILQRLPEYGQIGNITVVTNTFNVINIKINAENSEVIKHGMGILT
ncbi:MAG: hypothetical protein KatS3mg002_0841 [Candidatus Woesearchaeota archaeon]|nr:MAG: hypothetical protein KatS3mg002_0841 [Candidatus Woesearchaeota archaeon]